MTCDPDPLQLAQSALFSRARDAVAAHILLDASQDRPLERYLSERPDGFVVRLAHPAFKAHPRFAPLLVRLTDAHDPLLDASVALAIAQAKDVTLRSRQIGGWIFDSRDQDALARHLSLRLTLSHPEGRARLRLHDPRVLAQLTVLLTQQQLAWLAGGMQAWCYLDEGAGLREVPRLELKQRATRLSVDSRQWQALQRAGAVNEVIRTLRMTGAGFRTEWLTQAHELLARAPERGHAELHDQIAYAVHSMLFHPRFDTHAAVRRALADARERNAGFCVAVSGFDESTLASIAQDLERAQEEDRKGSQNNEQPDHRQPAADGIGDNLR